MLEKKLIIKTEVYSRIAGYFRPVNQWNKGKKEEFNERVTIKFQEDYDECTRT